VVYEIVKAPDEEKCPDEKKPAKGYLSHHEDPGGGQSASRPAVKLRAAPRGMAATGGEVCLRAAAGGEAKQNAGENGEAPAVESPGSPPIHAHSDENRELSAVLMNDRTSPAALNNWARPTPSKVSRFQPI